MASITGFLKKYWWVWLLVAIMVFGFWVRSGAMRYSDLPDIDTYYWVRMNEYMLSHSMQLPVNDMLRNWPFGVPTAYPNFADLPINYYLPSSMYLLLNPILNESFYRFAFIEPIILAAIGIILMFFLAKELFDDRRKAIISTFFFATIPAAITRLSAGEIEKEANSVILMLLSMIFFIKSYKSENWKWKGLGYGILSGLFTGLMAATWGGTQFIIILFALFSLGMLLINKPERLWHSFIPTILVCLIVSMAILPRNFIDPLSYEFLVSYVVIAMLLVRMAAEKFSLIKKESLKFLPVGIMILIFVGTLVSSIFSDYIGMKLTGLWNMITLYQPGLTTVAESIPGDWSSIVSQSGVQFAQGMLPQLTPISIILSVWFLMLLGAALIAYKFVRYREHILLLPVIFLGLSIFGTYYALRLAYFVGFSGALTTGYLCGWLMERAYKIKTTSNLGRTSLIYLVAAGFFGMVFILTLSNPFFAVPMLIIAVCLAVPGYAMRVESHESWIRRMWVKLRGIEEVHLDIAVIPVVIFMIVLVVANIANAYSYGNQLGPSINQYIDDAMKFMREQTPQNTSILSWWDFGYWFQEVGQRATIVDGGGTGNTSRFQVATWFTDDSNNWSSWTNWLNDKLDVGYILMDYTMPGKYGAISKIASHETNAIGIIQFDQVGANQQGNTTIYEFGAGPYRIWLPMGSNGNLAGTPIFLVTDSTGTSYSNKAYINDMCTEKGIVTVGNETQTIGGCVAITTYGLFYVPAEAEHTIFTSLMFMDGSGLTEKGLTKIFDNGLIHIYDLKNTTH